MKKTVTKTVEYTYECYESNSDNLLEKMIADAKADVGLINEIKSQNIAMAGDQIKVIKEMINNSKYLNSLGLIEGGNSVVAQEGLRYSSRVYVSDKEYSKQFVISSISQPGKKFTDSKGGTYRLACDYNIIIKSCVNNFVKSNCSLDEFLEEMEKDSQYMSKIIKSRVKSGLL